jgi:transposase
MAKGRRKIHNSVVNDARELFMDGWTQQDIARFLSVSEKTIGEWKNEHEWDKLKLNIRSVTENAYELLAYQLDTLRQLKDAAITEGVPFKIEKDVMVSIAHLSTLVKKPEMKFAQASGLIKKFIEYLMIEDLELARQIKPIAHKYIIELQKLISQ